MDALNALKSGQVALLATDTVYGLAALPGSEGYRQIFQLKARPQNQVLPWLVKDASVLDVYGAEVPDYAYKLAAAFWPGALTLVVRASDKAKALGDVEADGTIALRVPDEPECLRILQELDSPLACTSANLHGKPAVFTLDKLDPAFSDVPRCSDLAGSCRGEEASAIVDCTGVLPIVLRKGRIPEHVLLSVALLDAKIL